MKPRRKVLAVLVLPAAIAAGVFGERTFAAFTGSSLNSNPSLAAAPDWTPPSASRSVAAKSAGGILSYLRPGGTYYTYAQVTDGGNPPAGVASVFADGGQGPVALLTAGGPWTIGGQTYNYRSAVQTVPAAPNGNYPYNLDLSDSNSPVNSQTQGGFSVNIDGTAPTAANIQTANAGTIVGRAQQNDTVTFTFSEQIEPISVLAGWDGTATTVTVRIANDVASFDRIQIRNAANSALLPLTNANGVSLARTDYTTATRDFTNSTMVQSGTTVTITLGTPSGATTTAAGNGTMSWTPTATITDRAGNPNTTAAATESGTADREF
jgi:hypothetical protein